MIRQSMQMKLFPSRLEWTSVVELDELQFEAI
jgi:hypothetical protein